MLNDRGLSNTPKLSPMEEGHEQLTGRQFARDLVNIQQSIAEEGVENVDKRTPSDPIETGCRGKNPSDSRESVRERLSKYAARYS